MEAIDLEVAQVVGGGLTLDGLLAALVRDGALVRNGSVMGCTGATFD